MALEAVTGGDLMHTVLFALVNPRAYKDADVVRWAYDIARGLHYLHTRKPMIIHRDLKLDNVLLDARTWQAKLTDFGLVKTIAKKKNSQGGSLREDEPETPAYASSGSPSASVEEKSGGDSGEAEKYVMTGGTGSFKYMAPETLKGEPANEKVDTYSLAICMWELMARKPLLFLRTKSSPTGARIEVTGKIWAIDAAAGTRPELPAEWPAELRTLMVECWAHDPQARPSQRRVKARLLPLLRPEEFTYPGRGGAGAEAAGQPGCSCCVQ